ncbi:MAG: hypothetical protein ILP07_11635, partial [Treponema sp.]|nr:hypothetical protein [Treponema sp.]
MKNRTLIFTAAFIFLASLSVTAQELGDKVQKKVTVDGKQLFKWVNYASIQEYDCNGNKIHEKTAGGYEFWFEYDSNGNKIHEKYSPGSAEYWYEYDSN